MLIKVFHLTISRSATKVARHLNWLVGHDFMQIIQKSIGMNSAGLRILIVSFAKLVMDRGYGERVLRTRSLVIFIT